MNQERYQQIDALVEAALQMESTRRHDFLQRACGSDQDLLEHVSTLLKSHDTAADFLERPAFEAWAHDVAEANSMRSLAGRQVGRYRIESHLGSGGIGEVWLARDMELSREVALKFLSSDLAGDSDQNRRFRREARAASSLNHPNLVTIFDIGEFEGKQFIAQEFVRGKTVRELLAAGPFSTQAAAQVAAQIAGGLQAAHAAGVVHRDIKPENIMIRPDGVVKVLDFGIARLLEDATAANQKPATGLTRAGIIVGTARYMSPEQARGLPVDGRSDIFSLGVVLYEMVTGAAPFTGATPSDILAAILTHEPLPLSRSMRNVPDEFDRVIRRCLAKDPAARYASAALLQEEFKRLETKSVGAGSRFAPWMVGALAVTALVAITIAFFMKTQREPAPRFNSMRIMRLSTRGAVTDVTIARDGSLLGYVVPEGDGQRIWIRTFSGSNDRAVVTARGTQLSSITFTPDDSFLYYRQIRSGEAGDLYRVAVNGGTPERVIGDVSGAAAVSPDGKQVAFIRLKPSTWEASLIVSHADGSGESTVQTLRRPQFFDEHSVAWSPDGEAVACFAGQDDVMRLVEINLRHPVQRVITQQPWIWPQSLAWSSKGGVLVVTAATPGDIDQLWTVRPDTGAVTRLTNDLSSYSRAAITDDGESLVAVHRESTVAIWASSGASLHFDRISASPLSSTRIGVGWTPDGRIIYSDPADGYRNLWRMDANGANPVRLTSSASNKDQFAVTRDGRSIVFEQDHHIWRVSNDGSEPKQLTHGAFEVHPDVSPDGKTVVYASFANWTPGVGGEPTLWRVPIDGGEATQISPQPASVPRVSPDGQQLACIHYPGRDPRFSRKLLAVLKCDGTGPFTVFQTSASEETQLGWSPDGQALDYVVNANGIGNLWREPLKGGAPTQVTHFDSDSLYDFSWSRDGRLVCTRGNTSREAVLIQNFR